MGRTGRHGGRRALRPARGTRGAVITATVEVVELTSRKPLQLVTKGDHVAERDLPARIYVELVALSREPVEPARVIPVGLILKTEGLVDLPTITFGSNYELEVRSIELDHGLVDALDAGWLSLRDGKVTGMQQAAPTVGTERVRARAQELFALGHEELMRAARHHLLRDQAA